MSEPTLRPHDTLPGIFRPGPFLVGLVAGLLILAWAGKHVSQTDYHPNFVRFIPPVSPEGNYYPTVDELCSIVRSHCRKDQTLVIVGGNSILLGVWQPEADVWTKRLQALLGDRYCVLNFAFRGASPSDTGAVVAEVLRKEYPHQIYIADQSAAAGVDPIGSPSYRFMFWQAYFGGRLENYPPRNARVADYLKNDTDGRLAAVDLITSNVADGFLHYKDLWNYIGFNYFFTISSLWGETVPGLLSPRKAFADEEPDIFAPELLANRYSPSSLDNEMTIVRSTTQDRYVKQPDGHYRLGDIAIHDLVGFIRDAFPDDLKARTLMLISQNSPHYRALLTPEEQLRDHQAYADSIVFWKSAGYDCMVYGEDFNEDDFGDRTHLSKLGGAKLADAVAAEVEALSKRLSYPQ